MSVVIEVDLPEELSRFQLPTAVALRLQSLLDAQNRGPALTPEESAEAEGLVELADLLSFLRLRSKRS